MNFHLTYDYVTRLLYAITDYITLTLVNGSVVPVRWCRKHLIAIYRPKIWC